MFCRGGAWCNNFTHSGYDDISSTMFLDMIEEEILRNSTVDFSAFEKENSAFEAACQTWKHSVRLYDAPESMPFVPFENDPKMLERDEEDLILTSTLMNPRTLEKVSAADIFKIDSLVEPREEPKPYHAWTHDHDYFGKIIKTESTEENSTMNSTKVSKSENEPIVEVWNIDSFSKDPQTADSDQADGVWNKYQVEVKGRRSSSRAVVLNMKTQARKISHALREVSNDKAKRTRQYKNVRPKNSVETTPSQSDIEEWSSVPAKPTPRVSAKPTPRVSAKPTPRVSAKAIPRVSAKPTPRVPARPTPRAPARPTHTKVTKKKTTKGRIDHSESERHRREVLRENFAALCELIPTKYLRGEKASSQISKQKILNGAKAFIEVLGTCKDTYKVNLVQNKHLRSRWQDRKLMRQQIEVLRKCMKKK